MAACIWLTPAGDLGIIPELEYYELPLDAYNPAGGQPTFTLISGSLPNGLELYDDGRILGIPVLGQIRGVPEAVNRVTTSTFTVRITAITGEVCDRTFNLTVAGILPPMIIPSGGSLGTFIDGNYEEIQLEVIEPNTLLTPTFSLLSGELPPGMTLTSDGLISGYITPLNNLDLFGPIGPTWAAEIATNPNYGPGFDWTNPDYSQYVVEFDSAGFDNSSVWVSKNYQFTVQVDDTVNTDVATYTIFVYSRRGITADNTSITVDDAELITVDLTTLYNPVLYTPAGKLADIRQNTKFFYQLLAEDYDNDSITFSIVGGSLPTGLSLDTATGWISGLVPYGSLGNITYDFDIQVHKTAQPQYASETKTYTLRILGQISDNVVWTTNRDLGYIYNGSISQLYVNAYTDSGRTLRYELLSHGALPPGLDFLPDGTIAGRATFQTFSLDGDTVIFDQDLTTFDQTFTFTVATFDSDNYAYDEKTFTLTIKKRDTQPYENLYIQVLPNREQRDLYNSIINNSDIIPNDYIYRQWDPWFGKNTLRRVLFLSGLNPKQVADYISAMELNHYWKTLNFGQVKTAQALDENFNVVYEVVYVDLIDNQVDSQGFGPNLSITWPTNTVGINSVYVNSFPNMATRIADNIGYENRSILPGWMTSRQLDGTVLGFTRALVLFYTNPGKSAEVAYRVKQVAESFKLIDFTIDRYEWDSILSENFEKQPAAGSGTITANTSSNVVLGTGTNFVYELYEGRDVYVSNVSLGTIENIVSSNVLTLTTNANSNVTSSSYTFGTNVFIVNNFVYATGNISSATTSNIITGITTNITGNGTISGTINSADIIGYNTLFAVQLGIGKNLYVSGNSVGIITSIQSNTNLTVSQVLSSNLANVSYTADGSTTKFIDEIHVNDTILVGANVVLGTVKTIVSNTNLILYSNSLSTVSNVAYLHTATDPYTTPTSGDKYLKFPNVRVISSEFTTPEY